MGSEIDKGTFQLIVNRSSWEAAANIRFGKHMMRICRPRFKYVSVGCTMALSEVTPMPSTNSTVQHPPSSWSPSALHSQSGIDKATYNPFFIHSSRGGDMWIGARNAKDVSQISAVMESYKGAYCVYVFWVVWTASYTSGRTIQRPKILMLEVWTRRVDWRLHRLSPFLTTKGMLPFQNIDYLGNSS
jgi:hypothetical protein